MMTSQAAGTAAAFAIDDNVPAQQVNYQKLAAQLLADGQLLSWGSVQTTSTNGIILTVNSSPGVTASAGWSTGANTGGWPLPDGTYWTDGNSGKGTKYVRFSPTIYTNGYYDVYLWWVYANNRATNTPVFVTSASGTSHVSINQQINCTNWFKIASSNYFNIGTGGNVTISNGNTSGYVIANAVRFMPLGSIAPNPQAALPLVEIVASDAVAGEFGSKTARFTVVCPNGANGEPLTVNYSVAGSAASGVDYASLPGSVTIPAGALAAEIFVNPLGDNLATNQVTLTINLSTSANYVLTNLSSAKAVILDRPINDWLRAHFTAGQLANPAISGDTADPASDGLPNLMKYALGLDPNTPEANPFIPAVCGGAFTVTYPLATSAVDAALTPQWSTNLMTWWSGTNYFQILNVADQITNQLVTIQPTAAASSGYFRFSVSRR
jgi:hypothetical protein